MPRPRGQAGHQSNVLYSYTGGMGPHSMKTPVKSVSDQRSTPRPSGTRSFTLLMNSLSPRSSSNPLSPSSLCSHKEVSSETPETQHVHPHLSSSPPPRTQTTPHRVMQMLLESDKMHVRLPGREETLHVSYAAVPSLARKGTGLLLLFHKLELVCQ
jgi:hypothetical protein